jgi:acetyl esterase/lipase
MDTLQETAARLEVERFLDVAYYDGPDADPVRHRLDLFVPKGLANYPTVLFVHGGAWAVGDKCCAGLYTTVAEFLAGQGVAVAMTNYRLSPDVQHPEHIKDVARAFAWVHRHIAEHGGSPERLFLAGHSAGGHLVSLLATQDCYLRDEGIDQAAIKGVISLSGVYEIPDRFMDVTFGGKGQRAFRFDELIPLRGMWKIAWPDCLDLPGIPFLVDVFSSVFGDDPLCRADASPIQHVRPGLPPFLVVCAEKDLPYLIGMAADFAEALACAGNDVRFLRVAGRNHNSVCFRAIGLDDPAAAAMLDFIRAYRNAKQEDHSANDSRN